jgi:predicted phage baseplate assembly protein
VYEVDARTGAVTFGNGVDGRIPPAGSQVFVTYAVSDGELGGVARNRQWRVAGFGGAFGTNPDPVTGGAAPLGWIEQRREARRRSREDHALVSSDDIVAAARALPQLEVARAWVLPPDDRAPRTGVVTLVALRSRPSGDEPELVPETRRWLEEIRRRLVGRMPLGARLVVAGPRYRDFSIKATLAAEPGRNPVTVEGAVWKELRKRLTLVGSSEGAPPRPPGVPVTRRDVEAWIRATDGVRRVVELRLRRADGGDVAEISVPRHALPRCAFALSTVEVKRSDPGSTA